MSPTQRLEILQLPLEVNNKEIVRRRKKAGRGKTTGISVSKRKEKSATGKLNVVIPPGKMVAVGPGAPDFVTEISVQVQKRAPFNVKKWKKVPDEAKNDIVSRVYNAFDIEQTDHNKAVILATADRLYRSHRGRLHQHFKQYETNEIALEHKPDELSEGDWEYLVDYFSSPDYKAMSERNRSNKAKQAINHRCGRKSFQAVSYDARDPETGKEPNYQDLWRMTHTNNSGVWIIK
ncbi:uncharacterized protein LOC130737561 [Lotus japonicus]|uniref:uncharacterized protein LOC130737561 n=1 Tax=Lotus japonicus TaxID=34305 RepID=UPI0025887358|nr:uncharacterized protein LOC130737561 [Lotus japonicus]